MSTPIVDSELSATVPGQNFPSISDQNDTIDDFTNQFIHEINQKDYIDIVPPIDPKIEAKFQQFSTQSLQTIISLLQTDPKQTNTVLTPSQTVQPIQRSSLSKGTALLSLLNSIQNGAGWDNFGRPFDPSFLRNQCSQQKNSGDTIHLLSLGHRMGSLFKPFIDLLNQLSADNDQEKENGEISSVRPENGQISSFCPENSQKFSISPEKFPIRLDEQISIHNFLVLGPTLQLMALSLGSTFDSSIFSPYIAGSDDGQGQETIDQTKIELGNLLYHDQDSFGSLIQLLLWSELNGINIGIGSDPLGELPNDIMISELFGNEKNEKNGEENEHFLEEINQVRIGMKKNIELKKKMLEKKRQEEILILEANKAAKKAHEANYLKRWNDLMMKQSLRSDSSSNDDGSSDDSSDDSNNDSSGSSSDDSDSSDSSDDSSTSSDSDSDNDETSSDSDETSSDSDNDNQNSSTQLQISKIISSMTVSARLSRGWSGQLAFWYQILSSGLGTQSYSTNESLHRIAFLSYQSYIIEHTWFELLPMLIKGLHTHNSQNSQNSRNSQNSQNSDGNGLHVDAHQPAGNISPQKERFNTDLKLTGSQDNTTEPKPTGNQGQNQCIGQTGVTWGDFFKRLVFNATQLFTPIHMLSNGIEPVSSHLDYLFDRAVENQNQRIIDTVSDQIVAQMNSADAEGISTQLTIDDVDTEVFQQAMEDVQKLIKNDQNGEGDIPNKKNHFFIRTYRDMFEEVKNHYYTYPIRPAITAPHMMINSLIGYGLLLPPLPPTARSDDTIVLDLLRHALGSINHLTSIFSKRESLPSKILSFSNYCYYWLFFSSHLLPRMIQFQQMEPHQRFQEYIKHFHYRRTDITTDLITTKNPYSSLYPLDNFLRTTPKFLLPWDDIQSTSSYEYYVRTVHTEPISQEEYDRIGIQEDNGWDGNGHFGDDDHYGDDNDNKPLSPSYLDYIRSLPYNPQDYVPYIFEDLVNTDFGEYNLIHDSFFYAISDIILDSNRHDSNIIYVPVASSGLGDPRWIRHNGRSIYLSHVLPTSKNGLVPIITPQKAKTMQLQELLLDVHNSHQATYRKVYTSPATLSSSSSSSLSSSSTHVELTSKLPPSRNVRDYNHKIADIMTFIDFNLVTKISRNTFCGIWPFINPGLSPYTIDSSRSQRLNRSPLGNGLLIQYLEKPAKKTPVNKSNGTTGISASEINTTSTIGLSASEIDITEIGNPNPKFTPTIAKKDLFVPSFQNNSNYSPTGLAFRVINSLQGDSSAIDELTTVLQGLSVFEPRFEVLQDLNNDDNGKNGRNRENKYDIHEDDDEYKKNHNKNNICHTDLFEEIVLFPPSPFLSSNEASIVYSDIVFGYTPTIGQNVHVSNNSWSEISVVSPTGWISHTTITASPTTIQIELLLYAILRRVQSSLLRFLFNAITDRQLLVDLCHIVELEYGIDHNANSDWKPILEPAVASTSYGRNYYPSREKKLDQTGKPELSLTILDSRIIQTRLTLAWCLEVAGTKTYAKDFIDMLESELAGVGWKGSQVL